MYRITLLSHLPPHSGGPKMLYGQADRELSKNSKRILQSFASLVPVNVHKIIMIVTVDMHAPSRPSNNELHHLAYGLFIKAISLAISAHSNSRWIPGALDSRALPSWSASSHLRSSYANLKWG